MAEQEDIEMGSTHNLPDELDRLIDNIAQGSFMNNFDDAGKDDIATAVRDHKLSRAVPEDNASTVTIIRNLYALANATPMREAFLRELELRLLRQAGAFDSVSSFSFASGVSTHRELANEKSLGRIIQMFGKNIMVRGNPIHSKRMSLALKLTGGFALLLIALGALLWSAQPQQANAEEIMVRAQRAAENNSAFGVRSYHGLVVGSNPGASGQGAPLKWQQEVWFLAPDKRRIEIEVQAEDTGQSIHWVQQTILVVMNGSNGWMYQPAIKQVNLFNPKEMKGEGIGQMGIGGSPSGIGFDAMLQNAGQSYNATLIGNGKVAGRQTYILSLIPKPGTPQAKWMSQATVWIDQQTFLQLRGEWKDAEGSIITEWAYTTLDLNLLDVNNDLFNFTPPPGTLIVSQ